MNRMATTEPALRASLPSTERTGTAVEAVPKPVAQTAGVAKGALEKEGQKVRTMLRARLGEDIYSSWFQSLEFEGFDGEAVRVSVPVKFLKNWIQSHYADDLLKCCAAEFPGAERVEVSLRQPSALPARQPAEAPSRDVRPTTNPPGHVTSVRSTSRIASASTPQRTQAVGLEGSPPDPRYTFDSFV